MNHKELDTTPTQIQLTLPAHIVTALKEMEEVSKKSSDEIVTISLKMFISTHNDYLKKS